MPTWTTLKEAGQRFSEEQLTDRAAALTYYGILALLRHDRRGRGD
ncbi:MAG TPA: hypothetical protein VHR88_05755 [Solirubrobacteraceae bacterium]|jgi:uncharacterized BrkB/YihY/UPF0761 family membrane protein|nr:hypothetical protein [Solirubrobacteraceae bacterium]